MEYFTVEETNLLCIYSTETRQALLGDLNAALPDVYDPDMRDIFASAIAKLEALSDAEYTEMAPGLIPADEYIEEKEG